MKLNRKQAFFTFGMGVALAISFGALSSRAGAKQIPNLLETGQHQQALDQARELYNALRDAGWDRKRVNLQLFRLPDQDFAEDMKKRGPGYMSFMTPLPEFTDCDDLAFFSSLYTRRNYHHGDGPEGRVWRMEGFFIVAMKSGIIEKVPIADVRLSPQEFRGETIYNYVFPRMRVYRSDLRKLNLSSDPPSR